jgi:hypothetical protein
MQATVKKSFVEVKGVTRHGGETVHECYHTGDTVTRDQKYEAQMLDPDRVQKNMGINKPNNLVYLICMPDEIVPIKVTMLELKTKGIINCPVSCTPLATDSEIEPATVFLPYRETRES